MKKVLLIMCVLFLQHTIYTQEKNDTSYFWVKKEDIKKYLLDKKAKMKDEYLKSTYYIDGQLLFVESIKDSVKFKK